MTKKIKTITIFCLVVLTSLFFALSIPIGNNIKTAYASQAVAQVDMEDLSGLGLGINVLTASNATDFETGYSVLDYDELQQMTAYRITTNSSIGHSYSTTNAESLLLNFSYDFGVDVGCETLIAGINAGLSASTTLNYENYSYKYYYVFSHDIDRYQCYIEDYAQQSTYQDKFSESFLIALNNLRNNAINYETFFDMFGTHIVGSAIYGGRLKAYYSLLSNTVDFNEDIKARVDASFSYLDLSTATLSTIVNGVNTSLGRNYSTTDVQTHFSVNTQGGSVIASNNINNFNSSYNNWCTSFDSVNNSVVVDFNDGGLVPIWDILPSEYSDLSVTMKNNFIELSQDASREFIDKYNTANYIDFNGGSGTAGDPYLLSTGQHLVNISKYMYANYELNNDINISGYGQWNAIGGHYKEKAFTGTLDGKGYSIRGLTRTSDIAEQNNRVYFGLFGYLGAGAVVENLYFVNTNISFTGPDKNNSNMHFFIGVVAGYSENATINNIRLTSASLYYNRNTNGWTYAGGVVGFANSTTISNCYNSMDISLTRKACVAGGIAVYSVGGHIYNCTNSAPISTKCTGWGGVAISCGIVGQVLDGTTNIGNCGNYSTLSAGKYSTGIPKPTMETNNSFINTSTDLR